MDTKRGQAMVELAVGLFTLALVASMVFVFTRIVLEGIETSRGLRCEAGRNAMENEGETQSYSKSTTVHAEEPMAKMFNAESVKVSDSVKMPGMAIDVSGTVDGGE